MKNIFETINATDKNTRVKLLCKKYGFKTLRRNSKYLLELYYMKQLTRVIDHHDFIQDEENIYIISEPYCGFRRMTDEEIINSKDMTALTSRGWELVLISKDLAVWSPGDSVLIVLKRPKALLWR